ncbi:MAG: TetR/AcrR family transcriptional regulator [Actinomycetia bacterium]|nr:TetR/AcrR family transcriptional regulator [Actinomycetes bacterium]MCP4227113.1 TetR/AcrR family transcriptional regulator [Actinomycetes bacterium]MCP5032410.1 TetR/AcrR family transcriptional regulator [Actinomycetes bacterium]
MPPQKQRTPALRQRISVEALDLLERCGPAGLRARAVASAAGTSTAAVYELFGDKAGLIQSLSDDGFEQLRTDLVSVASSNDPAQDVRSLFEAIRRFGRKRPQLFEVMFSGPFEGSGFDRDDGPTNGPLFALVVDRVARWLDNEGSEADPTDVTRVLISANRGLVTDENVGLLGSTLTSRTRRWNLTFDALLAGIAGHDRA